MMRERQEKWHFCEASAVSPLSFLAGVVSTPLCFLPTASLRFFFFSLKVDKKTPFESCFDLFLRQFGNCVSTRASPMPTNKKQKQPGHVSTSAFLSAERHETTRTRPSPSPPIASAKTSRTIVVLRRANGSPERKCSSSPERPILTQKTAKSAILAQFGLFKKIVRIDQFCAELHLFSRNLFVQPRTTIVRGIF